MAHVPMRLMSFTGKAAKTDLLRAVQATVFLTSDPSTYSAFNINELQETRRKMKQFRVFAIAVCLLAVGVFLVPNATADDWNRKTTVTFSAPVEVPGVGAQVLPAGIYVFKILDSMSDRHI